MVEGLLGGLFGRMMFGFRFRGRHALELDAGLVVVCVVLAWGLIWTCFEGICRALIWQVDKHSSV